jgi:hypothetical protein
MIRRQTKSETQEYEKQQKKAKTQRKITQEKKYEILAPRLIDLAH